MANLTKTQIDRLGERLKVNSQSEADLQLLEEYRRSFGEAYDDVVRITRNLNLDPSGRRAKSTSAIVEKLQRESIRLSQMQDIAGCRIVVANLGEQDQVVASLQKAFAKAAITDRRDHPSSGYRAVHMVVEAASRAVEIQVRTLLQHLWAELSERSADLLDPAIKYGGGPAEWQSMLEESSILIVNCEKLEKVTMEDYLVAFDEFSVIGAEFERKMVVAWERLFSVFAFQGKEALRVKLMQRQRDSHEQQKKEILDRLTAASIAENASLRQILTRTAERLNEMISAIADLERRTK